jgi:hypothetical protein
VGGDPAGGGEGASGLCQAEERGVKRAGARTLLGNFVLVVLLQLQRQKTTNNSTDDTSMGNEDNEFQKYLHELKDYDQVESNELHKYMSEPLLKHNDQFDILLWWTGRVAKYPILTQIARDVLAIQVSTVASESAFSAGGRVVDPYRNRLGPEIVEALICTKDWVAASRKGECIYYDEVQIYSYLAIILLILMHICLIQGATKFPTMIDDLEVLDFVIAAAMNHENEMDKIFKDY